MKNRVAAAVVGIVAAELLVLPFALAGAHRAQEPVAGTAVPATPLDAMARKAVVEEFAGALAEDYAFADVGRKMAQRVRAQLAAGAYERITSGIDLAAALQSDARSISNDKHLRVSYDPRQGPVPVRAGPLSPAELEQMRTHNGDIRKVQILPGNVGYMEVNGVPPLDTAREAIAAAFAFVHDTDALIIDARGNGGGDPETVALYMSYLSEGPSYVVNTIHTRKDGVQETRTQDLGKLSYGAKKPVFCLTARRTFSGGEELAYDIQGFKRGLIVGETTGGGAHPTDLRSLSHGFIAFMPFGYSVHPVTGKNWEGVGVKPDVEVAAVRALPEAHRLAVDRVKAGMTDAVQRAALERLSSELRTDAAVSSGGGASTGMAANRVVPTEIVGSYAAGGAGQQPLVTAHDGSLFLQLPRDAAPSRLVPLGADRYHLEGLADDFVVSFREEAGKIQLIASMGRWPPLTAWKQ